MTKISRSSLRSRKNEDEILSAIITANSLKLEIMYIESLKFHIAWVNHYDIYSDQLKVTSQPHTYIDVDKWNNIGKFYKEIKNKRISKNS